MNGFTVAENIELQEFNSMRLKSKAKKMIIPFSEAGACEVMTQYYQNTCPIILGKGSNTIFALDTYDNILYTGLMNKLSITDNIISVECGVTLHDLAWFASQHSVAGFEYLEDIPGSVGGALTMNAGTYDDFISNQVLSVKVYDYEKHDVYELSNEKLLPFWGKRKSYFLNHKCFIMSCKLYSDKNDTMENIIDRMLEIKKKRYSKQPRNYPSAGSVFKRPYVNGEPRYVWKLLDDAGLRGRQIGGARVSEIHPGFIVNVGNATGKDILDLVEECKSIVAQNEGIVLQTEWIIA